MEKYIKTFGRSELAQLYFPTLLQKSAWQKLKSWLILNPALRSLAGPVLPGLRRLFDPARPGLRRLAAPAAGDDPRQKQDHDEHHAYERNGLDEQQESAVFI